jgi:hypothetical protein
MVRQKEKKSRLKLQHFAFYYMSSFRLPRLGESF